MTSTASRAPAPSTPVFLTEAEAGLWRHQQRHPLSPAYNICAAVEIDGRPDPALLRAATRTVIARHRTLHSVVEESGEQLAWRPASAEPCWRTVPVTTVGLRSWAQGSGAAALEAEARRPFVQGDVLHRLVLWDAKAAGALLQITVHHCACDGLSLRRLVDEIIAAYQELAGGPAATTARRKVLPYQPLVTPEEARDFFTPRLQLVDSAVLLAPGRNRRRAADDAGVLVQRVLDVTVCEATARAKEAGASPFAVVLAGIGAALSRFSGESEVAVRVPFSHRPPAEDTEVSFRVRALPVRLPGDRGDTVAALLAKVGGELRQAAVHADWGDADAPFTTKVASGGTSVTVVNQLQPAGLLTHHRPAPVVAAGLRWRPYLLPGGTAKFALSIHVAAADGRLALTFEYRANAVDAREREWFADFAAVTVTDAVTTGLDEPAAAIGRSSGSGAARGRRVRQREGRVEDAFFAYATWEPGRIAVVDDTASGAQAVTYAQVAAASLAVAEHLTGLGVGAGRAIAVCLPRGAALIAAVHGVLRARGVLLLCDPDLPPARAQFMFADSLAHLLIEPAVEDGPDTLRVLGQMLRVTVLTEQAAPVPLARDGAAAEAAYVMYTSGSTGTPKGIAVSHAGLINRLAWVQRAFPTGPGNVVLAKTALSFDVCLWELLWPPMTGATLVTARHGRHADPAYLCDVLDRYAVDTVHFVPAMLTAFLDTAGQRRFPALKRVFTSGERLPLSLARRAHAQLGICLHNLYGPTEASIDVTAFTYRPGDGRTFVPIGRPVDNICVRVCDEDGAEVPLGAVGELVIEGVQVALGYVGDGSLDEGRFSVNPDSGQRAYRTGDLARWRSGQVLEFRGRADDQVKINGQRVELAEIDAALAGHPDVAAAAVADHGESAGRRLHAYLIPCDGAELSVADLRAHAEDHLAAALIPAGFTVVEELPYAASGKLDRARLTGLTGHDLAVAATTRTDPVPGEGAALLAAAAGQVLDMPEVPADTDLFHLGLDSITALRLVGLLRRRGAVLEVADIYEARTLTALAARLHPAESSTPPSQAPAEHLEPVAPVVWKGQRVVARFPLSQMQLGLLYHQQASDDYLTYLTSYELDGAIDAFLLSEALTVVAGRHEFCRSAVDLTDPAGPRQVVLETVDVELIEHDLTTLDATARQLEWGRWRHEARTRPFSWDHAPLFAFHLHHFTPETSVFSIVEPFLDGWSVAVLGRDILDTYEHLAAARAGTPPPATAQPLKGRCVSYGRFVELETEAATDEHALAHWRTLLEQEGTAWRLALAPGDPEEPVTWNRWDHHLDEAEAAALREAANRLGVSLRTLIWAVHMRTVALFTGQERSGSAVMVNGRPEEPGAEDMVGLFLNMLPAAVAIRPETTWRDLVGQLVAAEQSSWRHRRTPYARLRALVPGFEPSCVFNYTDFHRYRDLFDDGGRALRLRQVAALDQTYVDLTVQCSLDPTGNRIRLSVDHRTPAVTVPDARRFLNCLVHAANAAARDFDAPVDADRLPAAELARVEEAGRGPSRTWPAELSLARIVDAHAAVRPDAVAVEDGEESYTYAELAALSRHYAHQIRRHGDGPHPVMGVMASRSARYWAAVLGIWRAGGTYVALSPGLPAKRLQQMTGQATVQLVFLDPRDPAGATEALPTAMTRLSLEALPAETVEEFAPQPLAEVAYALFTSGSTGRPKGARIGPAEMANHWWAKTDLLNLDEACVVGQSAPASFDVSIWQFAVPWLRGGRVVVLDDALLLDPARLFQRLDERGVRLFETVPSHLAALLDAIDCRAVPWPRSGSRLDCLMVTGEAVPAEVCRRWLRAGGAPIVNAYGPTECADDITHQLIDDPDITGTVPIGRPIPNITCQVTDAHGQPVPLGMEGELRVTGACLGLGYLDPADEPGRFLRNERHEVVAYRTGDRVRFTQNGELLWLGRIDAEVKVRGRRIELGDIESHLRTHPAVKDAAATVGEDGGRLRAVVVPRTGHTVHGEQLRAHLRAHLPGWMLPDEITLTSALPLTPHGKLDRTALTTASFAPTVPATTVPPRARVSERPTAVAEAVAEEWARITGRAPELESDFFAEGGSSLDSVRLTARISARLGRPVTVADLLRAPRFADLIRLITPALAAGATVVPSTPAVVAGVITAALDDPDELLGLVPGGRLDAAAVGYLTPAALARAGHPADDVLSRFQEAPVLRRIMCTPFGTVGHYLLPLLADELFTAPARLAHLISQAADQAHRHGAARIALTGLIPAATKYGTTLPRLAAEVTTGHEVTTASVVLNVARALRTTNAAWADQHVAVIGLGSIGRASTQLLLNTLGHPASLTLVESRTAEHRLTATAQAVRATGYDGPLTAVTAAPDEVTGHVADASVIVGAASATGLLDTRRLAAGTIVIDDSAPHLFDTAPASNRARAGELYVSEGGVLQWPEPLREFRWAPTDPLLADVIGALRGYRPSDRTVMGCLTAALPALTGGLLPVLGEPALAQTAAVYQHLRQAGFDGTPMMLDDSLLAGGGA